MVGDLTHETGELWSPQSQSPPAAAGVDVPSLLSFKKRIGAGSGHES